MKNRFLSKPALSPFVAVAFGVISATGVLLFFHVKNGPIMVLHEWFGWAFVIAGVIHLLLNWRPLLSYFKVRGGWVSVSLACVLIVGLMVLGLNHSGGSHGSHSPLAQIAED